MLGNRVHFLDACFSASLLRCWSAMRIVSFFLWFCFSGFGSVCIFSLLFCVFTFFFSVLLANPILKEAC